MSSNALQLQAEELRNSVAQQTVMAQAAMKQIDSQLTALRLQEQEVERSLTPSISAESGIKQGGRGGGAKIITYVSFLNSGPDARAFKVSFMPPIGQVSVEEFGTLRRGSKTRPLKFEFTCPHENFCGECIIDYARLDGKRLKEMFTYFISSDNPFVRVERREPPIYG